uniref:Uncharacterized protein n=1 Tax=Globisporangium ultimum (strain ATCC 200006 / CBS 805.95 / DAOM BR144) TaxID=431595 RepID=K3X6D9_GLOUD
MIDAVSSKCTFDDCNIQPTYGLKGGKATHCNAHKLDEMTNVKNKRPDGFIECLTHAVIVEIDEDQHVEYYEMCNNRRTMELFKDVGSRPIVFIRLNPGSYVRNGKRTRSIFTLTDSGALKRNEKQLQHRFEAPKKVVQAAIETIPTRTISTHELFYSEL